MPTLTAVPRFVALDANGDPIPGARLYTYARGTRSPKPTYTDETGARAARNPIICDATGQADLWLKGLYHFELKDANDVFQWREPTISGGTSAGTSGTASSTFENLPTPGVPGRFHAVTNKQRGLWMENQNSTQWVPIADATNALHWDVYPGVNTLTQKLTLAVNACVETGTRLYLPAGTYTLATDLLLDGAGGSLTLCGAGRGKTIITTSVTPTSGTQMVRLRDFVGLHLQDISFNGGGAPGSGFNRQVLAMQGCRQSVVERCEFYNAYAFGQLLEQNPANNVLCEAVSFRDCWAHNNGNQGFSATGCRNCDFSYCHAWDNTFNGFDLEVNSAVGSFVNNCSMNFCTAYDNGTNGINIQGIATYDPGKPAAVYEDNAGWHIIGNRCYGNGEAGIHLVDTHGGILMGNFCRNNERGIHVEHGPGADGNGVNFQDFIIVNNICKGNDENGILVQGDGADFLESFILSNNILRGNGTTGVTTEAGTRYAFMSGNLALYNTVSQMNIASVAFTRGLGREQTAGNVNETARPRLPLPTDTTSPMVFHLAAVAAGVTADMVHNGATVIPSGSSMAAVKLAIKLSGAAGASQSFTVSLVVDNVVKNFSVAVAGASDTEGQTAQELAVATGTNWGTGQNFGLSVTASGSATTRNVTATLYVITFPNG